jgi:proteic killer suppression protein
MAELRAAEAIDDLLAAPGRWERLAANRVGQWSGRVSANWRIIVEPVLDGNAVIVLEIVDYH